MPLVMFYIRRCMLINDSKKFTFIWSFLCSQSMQPYSLCTALPAFPDLFRCRFMTLLTNLRPGITTLEEELMFWAVMDQTKNQKINSPKPQQIPVKSPPRSLMASLGRLSRTDYSIRHPHQAADLK